MSDLYVDRLGNVTIANGVARLDFLRFISIDPESKQAKMVPSTRLVLPVDGLAQTIDMLEKLKAGLIKQQQAAQAAPPTEVVQ